MKNKTLLVLLLLVSIFFITGCGCSKIEEEENKLADDEVIIKDVLYKLNQDENGYGINYKIASNFRKVDSGNALNYYGEKNEDNSSNFVIRVFHYKNKNLEYAINDTVEEYDQRSEVEIDGVKYIKIHFTNYNDANTYLFYYVHGSDVYVFCFTAWTEEERLENIFLKQIRYE